MPQAPTARVNDYAGLLAAADRDRLEAVLAERERATGAQMAIAIFRSLEGENLEDFSIRLAQRWRVGMKGLDNGAILVVFVNDRKLRLEVGYGLEPVVTDAVAAQIIREVIAPRFREGRYAAGLEGAVEAVFERVRAPRPAPTSPAPPRRDAFSRWLEIIVFTVFFGLVGIVLLVKFVLEPLFPGSFTGGYTARPGGWEARRRTWPGADWRPSGLRGGFRGFSRGGGGGGGFRGGGGSFGGGGASGSW